MKLNKKQVLFLGSIASMINSFSCNKKGVPSFWVSPWMVAVPEGHASKILESFKMKNAKTLYKQAKILQGGMDFLESIGILWKERRITGTMDSDGRTFEHVYFIKSHEKIKSLVNAFYSLIGNKVKDLSFDSVVQNASSLDDEEKPKKRKIMKKSATIKPATKIAKAKKASAALKKTTTKKKA